MPSIWKTDIWDKLPVHAPYFPFSSAIYREASFKTKYPESPCSLLHVLWNPTTDHSKKIINLGCACDGSKWVSLRLVAHFWPVLGSIILNQFQKKSLEPSAGQHDCALVTQPESDSPEDQAKCEVHLIRSRTLPDAEVPVPPPATKRKRVYKNRHSSKKQANNKKVWRAIDNACRTFWD